MNITLLLSKLGLSPALSQDIMLIIFVALVSFVYGMLLGKHRIMAVLINIYTSLALVTVVPETFIADYNTKLIVFFVLVIGLTVLSKRFFDLSLSGSGSWFMFRVFSMSFLQIVLLLSIAFSITPKKIALGYISPNAFDYLTTGYGPLIWMALPLVFMFFIYKQINK